MHKLSVCYCNSSIFFTLYVLRLFCLLILVRLQSIKRKDDPQEVKVQMQFMIYGTRPSKDKSGAYLFLPDGKAKVSSVSCCVSGASQWALMVSLVY